MAYRKRNLSKINEYRQVGGADMSEYRKTCIVT